MTSSARWSPDHATVTTTTTTTSQGRAIALALACALALGTTQGAGAQDAPAPAIAGETTAAETTAAEAPAAEAFAPGQPGPDQPGIEPVARNGGALAECAAGGAEGDALSACLETAAARIAAALTGVVATATSYFAEIDAITGNHRASLTLDQGQAAFELYRDLDCHLEELAQGVSTAAADHGRACRIDHDRARIAKLAALLPPLAPGDPAPEPSGPGEQEDPALILDTAWRAIEIDGTPLAADVEITLAIDDAAAVSGLGGCNRYFGTAEIAGARIDMGALGATRMACPDPAMSEERRYLQALEAVTTWRLDGEALVLDDATGTTRVRLERDAG